MKRSSTLILACALSGFVLGASCDHSGSGLTLGIDDGGPGNGAGSGDEDGGVGPGGKGTGTGTAGRTGAGTGTAGRGGTTGGGAGGTTGTGTAGATGGGAAGATGTGAGGAGGTLGGSTSKGFGCTPGTAQCSDGKDNDGDGKIDAADPECSGPCDNDEGTYATGIPGDNVDPCKQDCFFDGNSGMGDDGCNWDLSCDPASPGKNSRCPYDPKPRCQMEQQQSQMCVNFCRRLTPNGCDCFGCCTVTVNGQTANVLLAATCSAAKFGDPTACPRCTPNPSCVNTCEHCELCVGKTTLPADCTPPPVGTPVGTPTGGTGGSPGGAGGSPGGTGGSPGGTGGSSGTPGTPPPPNSPCPTGVVYCGNGGACPTGYCVTGCCLIP